MSARAILFAAVAALALVIPLTAQAGLYAPAEDAFLSREVSFAEDPLDAATDCAEGLEVGVGIRDIIPGDKRSDGSWDLWMEPFEDVNGNGVYDAYDPLSFEPPSAPDEPFTDENLNGKWDAPFMAGYGHEKAGNEYYVAEAVHDPVWARAVALTCGDTTLGLVSVDTVGLFRGFVVGVRAEAPAEYDHVTIASTHTHDSFDTMGLWGAHQLSDGKHPRAMAHIHARILEALAEALAAREPVAAMKVASAHTRDVIPVRGTIQTDLRDPFVIDDKVVAAQFLGADGVIATIVNWAPHPETMAGTKSEISSDYAHSLRENIETRFGGQAVFFSGAVGGMMTTLGARPVDASGQPYPDHSYQKVAAIGNTAADIVGDALAVAPSAPIDGLRVQTRLFNVVADNPFLLALNSIGVLDHETYLASVPLPAVGEPGIVVPVPFLRAEVNVITITSGSEDVLQALTMPGEMLPEVPFGNPLSHDAEASFSKCFAYNSMKELFNGAREGKVDPATAARSPGFERQLAANPQYPKEPAFARNTTGRETMLFGLANDELGYMVSADDFVMAQMAPEVFSDGRDRCGDSDHYEETNSASSLMAMAVANNLQQMLQPDFVPAAMPAESAGLLPDGLGLWIDSSRSGGYEKEEDARVQLGGVPSGVPECFGWLNGHGQDQGQEPDEDTRGIWFDVDGDCEYGAGDGVLFADMWAVSEGQPFWRP